MPVLGVADGACKCFTSLVPMCIMCWCLSTEHRNRVAHAVNGNTQTKQSITKAKWESSLHEAGVQLHFPDMLKLPGDAIMQILRADQGSVSATPFFWKVN